MSDPCGCCDRAGFPSATSQPPHLPAGSASAPLRSERRQGTSRPPASSSRCWPTTPQASRPYVKASKPSVLSVEQAGPALPPSGNGHGPAIATIPPPGDGVPGPIDVSTNGNQRHQPAEPTDARLQPPQHSQPQDPARGRRRRHGSPAPGPERRCPPGALRTEGDQGGPARPEGRDGGAAAPSLDQNPFRSRPRKQPRPRLCIRYSRMPNRLV